MLLKQYGPVVGVLIAFIVWQSRKIDQLLDRHEKAYSGEIERMSQHMGRLLDHVLGPLPSSTEAPTMGEIRARATRELPSPDKNVGGGK